MNRELLQQALDALLHSDSPSQKRADAIAALREALAAPQPEPVAEVIDREHQPWEHGKHTSWLVNPSDLPAGTKLYAAAPPAAPAPVVPLTDEQFADMVADASLAVDLAANPLKLLAFARAVLSAAPAAPRPDEFTCPYCFDQGAAPAVPVAWEYQNQHGNRFLTHRDPAKWHENDRAGFNNFRALGYVAPAVREPLTDEQIDALWSSPMSADWEHREFARAIEAHHGIGGGGK